MLEKDSLFKQYHHRMVREGIFSSVCFGLMIASGAVFVSALVCWLLRFTQILLPLAIGGGVLLVSSILFFVLKFRPTERKVARRIDQMGLEERTVTMLDLAEDDSYIARKQREDTREKVREVKREQVRSNFPLVNLKASAVFMLCAALVMGAGMTTVMGLTGSGVIPSPDILPSDEKQETFFTVTYLTEGEGDIEGEADQTVLAGEDATTVVAVPQDGWIFVKWSDGVKSPERTDLGLTDDLEVTATFEEIGDGSDGEDGDGAGKDDDADADKDVPDDNKTDGASSAGSDGGDGGEGNSDGDKGDGSGSGNGGQEGGGKGNGRGEGSGGGWSEGNQVIDGKTDYRDVYDNYYDEAMEIIRNGGELPDYLKEFIEKYYGSI
ncbi:MAG TPA: hypothetical protein DDW30_03770 [Clostridiales bacterium]|nr:hypothetical protein [Clostridiales bacterium]